MDDADPDAKEKKTNLVEEMKTAIYPLHSVGLLGLFTPDEWIGDGTNRGRTEFGRQYRAWLSKRA